MRRETVELIRKAIAKNRRAYVLVNHRAKGNAPLTVQGSVLGVLWPVKMTTDSLRICFKTGTPSSIVCSDNRLSSLDFDLRFPHRRLAVGLEIPSLDGVQF